MNTPAHLAASVLVWRNEPGWGSAAAVTVGALLPDLPMYGFYAYQRLWLGSTEREIWSTVYFQRDWQLLFDTFNSIPLAVLIIVIYKWLQLKAGVLLGMSMLLHLLCDLAVHHDDAHRHFLPLWTWRFESPISYWDPRHYGHIFIWFELLGAIGACLFVSLSGRQWPLRTIAMATLGLYVVGILLASVAWMFLLR